MHPGHRGVQVVPDDAQGATGHQNAPNFGLHLILVEPMPGLCRHDGVDGFLGKACAFSGAGLCLQTRTLLFGENLQHRLAGLDGVYLCTSPQQRPGHDAGACAKIGADRGGLLRALPRGSHDRFDHGLGVSGP